MILHSPTERGEVLTRLKRNCAAQGIELACTSYPESIGADFAWLDIEDNWRGIQRKELGDFLASLDDGRLAKEIKQLNAFVTMPVLILEGRLQVVNGGDGGGGMVSTGKYRNDIAWDSYQRRLMTIMHHGLHVVRCDEPKQTADWITAHYQWSMSASHETGSTRPKPTGDWGKPTNRDWQVHLLTALDGVGRKTAEAVLDELGRCPLRLDATVMELMQVPGIGRKTAVKMIESVNGVSAKEQAT